LLKNNAPTCIQECLIVSAAISKDQRMRLPVMVYFASGESFGAITFSSAAFIAARGFNVSAGFIASIGFIDSIGFIGSTGFNASRGFNTSAEIIVSTGAITSEGFFAPAGFSGTIAHANPWATHKKSAVKKHTEARAAT
jgi:hypothetical protein